jgi:hypothetical protein
LPSPESVAKTKISARQIRRCIATSVYGTCQHNLAAIPTSPRKDLDIPRVRCAYQTARMESSHRSSTSLFDVYLRLRPPFPSAGERFLDVEPCGSDEVPKHITIKPPANDYRKRAVERFAFTRVFEEHASQTDLYQGSGVPALIQGVLGHDGHGRDGLLATLGVTGSGKVCEVNVSDGNKTSSLCLLRVDPLSRHCYTDNSNRATRFLDPNHNEVLPRWLSMCSSRALARI